MRDFQKLPILKTKICLTNRGEWGVRYALKSNSIHLFFLIMFFLGGGWGFSCQLRTARLRTKNIHKKIEPQKDLQVGSCQIECLYSLSCLCRTRFHQHVTRRSKRAGLENITVNISDILTACSDRSK